VKVVFAKVTAPVTLPSGITGMVRQGTHWPADDPVVAAHPEWFSGDPRFGMNYSVEPDEWDAPVGEVASSSDAVEAASAAPGEFRQGTRRRRFGADSV